MDIRNIFRRAQARSGNHTVDKKGKILIPGTRIIVTFTSPVKLIGEWKWTRNGQPMNQ